MKNEVFNHDVRGQMKPNQKSRYNGRYNNNRTYRPQQQTIFRNTALDSNGPCGKLHGTALQLSEKYQNASKDASLQNDSVLAETCLQFADHYMRLQNIAIANEENLRSRQTQSQPQPQIKPQESPVIAPAPIQDELPSFAIPAAETTEKIQSTKTPEPIDSFSAEDEAIKNMDLSIPISAIQQKHGEPAKLSRGPRPMRKPRPAQDKTNTPAANTADSTTK